ncbi:MAG: serine/threonine protein kinase [Anaerolineales bacterium]|nr:serine/threonine protein kinase [Anaerolineales bacterium]MBP6208972.1 serine/threonine protein kinase [Anaerolineales bacterium]
MPQSLKKGEILRDRYKIREQIGQGGTGSIYLAEDTRLEGRLCALKEVEHNQALPTEVFEQAREQFFREASVLARLDHPNLPKVSDYFSVNTRDYLVMDYVPGKDLRERMQEARRNKSFISENEILRWAVQIADALNYLHNQEPPIIHRDIKPSNLKITPSGLIKLVDFGLVKIMAPNEVTITIIQGQGTALYTPLEQYGGDDTHTDIRADIFSFGATLYNLVTNEAPAEARKRFLSTRSLTPPREINPNLSPRVEKAILWAMSLHPDDRPKTVIELREALLGKKEIPERDDLSRPGYDMDMSSFSLYAQEQIAGYAAVGLFLIGLVITLLR